MAYLDTVMNSLAYERHPKLKNIAGQHVCVNLRFCLRGSGTLGPKTLGLKTLWSVSGLGRRRRAASVAFRFTDFSICAGFVVDVVARSFAAETISFASESAKSASWLC